MRIFFSPSEPQFFMVGVVIHYGHCDRAECSRWHCDIGIGLGWITLTVGLR
jgi:hypothetical protein